MQIDSLLLYVADPQRSAEFYEALGFTLVHADPSMAAVTLGDFGIQLINKDDTEFQKDSPVEPKGAGVFIYIKTDDIDSFYDSLIEKELNPSSKPKDFPWGNREFAIKDPDGYKLVFYERNESKVSN